MNYNIWIAICVVVILIIASLVWNRFFIFYLKKSENNTKYKVMKRKAILNVVKPTICLGNFCVMCLILLSNTDDEISDTLDYIKPSKCINNLLEKINEQTRI